MSDFQATSILPILALEDAAAKPVLVLPEYTLGYADIPEMAPKRKYPFDELKPPADGQAAYFGVPRTEKTLGRLYAAVHNREKHHAGEKYKVVKTADSVRVYRVA